jgi:hypothetical protein
MALYQTTRITLLKPTSFARVNAPAQGQRANEDDDEVCRVYGILTRTRIAQTRHALGETAADLWSWQGHLPEAIHPRPGWRVQAEAEGWQRTFAIVGATRTLFWNIDLREIP